MKLLTAFFMCLGMFTALPVPWRPWDEDARDWMLVMLPAVGLVIGLLWAALGGLGMKYLPGVSGAILAALPWLLTGFIHLDGCMDTCDALLSWRPLEKRLEILKDSHTGAFAVVGLVIVALFCYDAAASLSPRAVPALIWVPVISRCGSALSVLTLRPIGHSQYVRTRGSGPQRAAVVVLWAAAMGACLMLLPLAAPALLVETLTYTAAMAWAFHTLKGVSGDVAGFALTLSETAALVALAATGLR